MKEFQPPIYGLVYPADGFCYAVDNSEIKEGDLMYHPYQPYPFKSTKENKGIEKDCKKIIATNNPAITDVPRLQLDEQPCPNSNDPDYLNGFEEGYKAAKGKGMYSEDDLDAFILYLNSFLFVVQEERKITFDDLHLALTKFKDSLKPKPIAVELDGQVLGTPSDWLNDRQSFVPKVVNNTVIVKRLIYEEVS